MNYQYVFPMLALISFSVPFVFPESWVLALIFPISTIWAMNHAPLSCIQTILGCFLSWSILLFEPCSAALTMCEGSYFIASILPLLLSMYMTILTTIWLGVTCWIIRNIQAPHIRYYVCSISVCCYLLTVEQGCIPLGHWYGYPFANPLIPLSVHYWFISPVYYLGLSITLALFCIASAGMLALRAHPRKTHGMIVAASIMPWLVCPLFIPFQKQSPAWLQTVGHLPVMFNASDAAALSLGLSHAIQSLIARHRELTLVILPESACALPPSWSNLPQSHLICLGAFQETIQGRFNVCCLYDAPHLMTYAKQNTIPYLESISHDSWLSDLAHPFHQKTLPTVSSSVKRHSFTLSNGIALTPYICSELFFTSHPESCTQGTILALCNDWWFSSDGFARIMLLSARLKAISWKKPILYIAYHHACYFDGQGFVFPLKTSSLLHFMR